MTDDTTETPQRPDVDGLLAEARLWLGAFSSKVVEVCTYTLRLEQRDAPAEPELPEGSAWEGDRVVTSDGTTYGIDTDGYLWVKREGDGTTYLDAPEVLAVFRRAGRASR